MSKIHKNLKFRDKKVYLNGKQQINLDLANVQTIGNDVTLEYDSTKHDWSGRYTGRIWSQEVQAWCDLPEPLCKELWGKFDVIKQEV